jgi:hypothetical protein
VAYEDVIDFSEFYPVAPELYLGTFSTINQEQPLIYIQYMSG